MNTPHNNAMTSKGSGLEPDVKDALAVFMAHLDKADLPPVSRALLYGSHARGDARAESDINIAVVLAGAPVSPSECGILRRKLSSISSSATLETEPLKLISAMLMWESMMDADTLEESIPVSLAVSAPTLAGPKKTRSKDQGPAGLEPDVKDALAVFMAHLDKADLPPVSRALLYGSHARGDARAESDIDIAVVLTGTEPPRAERNKLRRKLSSISADVLLETLQPVSAVLLWEPMLDKPDDYPSAASFCHNILEDAMPFPLSRSTTLQ